MGQRPTGSHGCVHENENMCQVIASMDRYPPQVKASLFFVIHMCPMVKSRESVRRLVKLEVRPRKFATNDFEYK